MALNLDYSFLTSDVVKSNILPGLYYSLQLTLVTMVGGIIIGTLVALMRLSSRPWLQRVAAVYVDTLRSIPLLMVILWFYLLIPSAFYALLAFFPGVAALGSVMGLLGQPRGVERKLAFLSDLVPADVFHVIAGEVPRFAGADHAKLAGAALLFAGVSVLSASSAVRQLMVALNVAYRRREHRGWLRRRLIATAFAAGAAVAIGGEVGLLARTGGVGVDPDGPGGAFELVLKWVATFLLSAGALALLYRYAPARRLARWRWVTPGGLFAAVVGLGTSAALSLYLAQVAHYTRVYGGLGVMLGVAVWLWAGMMVVLAGAELNDSIERRTSAETCEEDAA